MSTGNCTHVFRYLTICAMSMSSPLGSISALEVDEESGAISVLLSAPPATFLGRPVVNQQGEVLYGSLFRDHVKGFSRERSPSHANNESASSHTFHFHRASRLPRFSLISSRLTSAAAAWAAPLARVRSRTARRTRCSSAPRGLDCPAAGAGRAVSRLPRWLPGRAAAAADRLSRRSWPGS